MLIPSISASYAIQALVFLARNGADRHGAEAISRRAQVPRPYLRKILRSLSRKGLVVTRRGQAGGYRLARPAETISLFEVLETMDGAEPLERCLLGLGRCSAKRGCPVHVLWNEHRKAVRARYRELTLRELAGFERYGVERDYHFGCSGKPAPPAGGTDPGPPS